MKFLKYSNKFGEGTIAIKDIAGISLCAREHTELASVPGPDLVLRQRQPIAYIAIRTFSDGIFHHGEFPMDGIGFKAKYTDKAKKEYRRMLKLIGGEIQ